MTYFGTESTVQDDRIKNWKDLKVRYETNIHQTSYVIIRTITRLRKKF